MTSSSRPEASPISSKSESGNFSVWDGRNGYGQVIARDAMGWATETARRRGVAVHGLRNTHHIGRVGAYGEIARVAGQLGVHREALRTWIRQAEIDGGQRPGVTTEDARRIAELEREVRELRRANEILKAASAYFARELDPRLPR